MPKTSPDAPDGGPTFTFHDLIIFAVEALNGGRKGSSVQAIKKHILTQYGVEVSAKNSHHFKRGLEAALEEDSLIRVTGAGGVTGSFRLPSKTNKKSPPTTANATVRTTRKKTPPANVDEVTSAMHKLAVRATEQPGTSAGALKKTRANGKMVAGDQREQPPTRKPVMKAAIFHAVTSAAPSSSKGKSRNVQPAAASRATTVKNGPVTSRPTAAKIPATSRPTAVKTKPAPIVTTKAAAKSGTSAVNSKPTGRGKIAQNLQPEAAVGRTRAIKNTTAPPSTSSAAGKEGGKGKQKNEIQLPKSNGQPRKLPAKTAVTIQKKAKALVLSDESEEDEEPEEKDEEPEEEDEKPEEEDEEPEEEDEQPEEADEEPQEEDEEPEEEEVDGNNNSVTESVKQDDKDSEEDPDASEYEIESNGTLIPPPSSSASHRSSNNVASESEESTDGEEVHNETGGSGTNVSVFDENPSSLDLSRHDRRSESSIDAGISDQMNSLTVEAPSSRYANTTSSTTNNQERHDDIKNEVVNETVLDESQGDTTVYDDENEDSDVSQIEATKYVPRSNQYSTSTEDEDEQETDDEGAPENETANSEDVFSREDQDATEEEVATDDEAAMENEAATEDEDEGTEDEAAVEDDTEDEDVMEDKDGTKDEDAMELTEDEDEEYEVSQSEVTNYVRAGRAGLGNEDVTHVIPNSEDEESDDEESEDEESEDGGTGDEGTEAEGTEAEGTEDEGTEGEGSEGDDESDDAEQ